MGEQQTQSVCDQPQDIRSSITSIINRNYYVNKYYEYDEFGKAVEKGDAKDGGELFPFFILSRFNNVFCLKF